MAIASIVPSSASEYVGTGDRVAGAINGTSASGSVAGREARSALADRIGQWRLLSAEQVRRTASAAYQRAESQIRALRDADSLAPRVQKWSACYGRRGSAVDLTFGTVRDNMLQALGGWDRDGDPDRLDVEQL